MSQKNSFEVTKTEKGQKFLEMTELLANRKILVVGDCGLDEYTMGRVRRISPEAPVPILEVDKEKLHLGMSANVAQNITHLKSHAVLISVVGADHRSNNLRQILKEKGIDDQFLVEDPNRPTTQKTRIMAGPHHIVRVDYEQKQSVDDKIKEKVLQLVKKHITECQAVIVQDYAKGLLDKSLIQNIFQIAKSHEKPVLVDPHRTTPLSFYEGADLFKPNLDESLALLKEPYDHQIENDEQRILNLAEQLKQKINGKQMVLTRGSKGVVLFDKEMIHLVPTYARQVFDVTGAGDTMIATLALAKTAKLPALDGCVLANFAAGFVVSKVGAACCSLDDLKDHIRSHLK